MFTSAALRKPTFASSNPRPVPGTLPPRKSTPAKGMDETLVCALRRGRGRTCGASSARNGGAAREAS